jgi:hypothetical protein
MCSACRYTGDTVAVGSVVNIARRCNGRFDNDKGHIWLEIKGF